VNGGETLRGKQIEADTNFVVEIRYRSDVTSKMKVTPSTGPHSGKTLNINSVTTVERRKPLRPFILMLNCVE
jgi:SPP1 family predicted phage head-tail adaptor